MGHVPKWQLALEMIDELAGWGLRPPVLCADAGYGNNGHFRRGLAERGIPCIVQVEDDLGAFAVDAVPQVQPYSGRGPRGQARHRDAQRSLREHVVAAGREDAVRSSWREGSRAALSSTFLAIRVRPGGRKHTHRLSPDGSLPPAWLLVDWPEDAEEPVKCWLSNLPQDTPLAELVRLGKIRWRIEHDYREVKEALGLDHFEGRTFTGWHRHVTLVTAAHLFATTLRADPKAQGAA